GGSQAGEHQDVEEADCHKASHPRITRINTKRREQLLRVYSCYSWIIYLAVSPNTPPGPGPPIHPSAASGNRSASAALAPAVGCRTYRSSCDTPSAAVPDRPGCDARRVPGCET